MSLPDPRFYPPVNARNPLIRQLMSLLTEHDANQADKKRSDLNLLITDLLMSNDNAALNAALMQAPALEAWQTLWHAIREVVETPTPHDDSYITLFAIPVIIVAGSAQGTNLSCEIKNSAAILQLLKQHKIINEDAISYILPEMLSDDTLSAATLSQLRDWKQSLVAPLSAAAAPELGFASSPLYVKEEAAYLRYIVGMTLDHHGQPTNIRMGGAVSQWGMALAQELGSQLQTKDATVLTIPRAPQPILAAQATGRQVLQETRLQLLASSAIRAIRTKGRTPVAIIAAHDNSEIRITLSAKEDHERWQGFVWPILAGDRVEQICEFAQTLFHDCQVSDIRVIEQIQPDRDEGLPFFVTDYFTAKSAH